MIQAVENARLKLQNRFKYEPARVERAKFFFGFLKHVQIEITLDRLKMTNSQNVFYADRFNDDPSHNSSARFDATYNRVVRSASETKDLEADKKKADAEILSADWVRGSQLKRLACRSWN